MTTLALPFSSVMARTSPTFTPAMRTVPWGGSPAAVSK